MSRLRQAGSHDLRLGYCRPHRLETGRVRRGREKIALLLGRPRREDGFGSLGPMCSRLLMISFKFDCVSGE